MSKNFIEELRWRGMLHDITPEVEGYLTSNKSVGYIGFDPTADSLHIGSLVQIIILMHFQNFGHTPIVLLGGATGMIGDPSGKSNERQLLDLDKLETNIESILLQFKNFLNFEKEIKNPAILINNYNWMRDFSLIEFSREIGKNITVNYMTVSYTHLRAHETREDVVLRVVV